MTCEESQPPAAAGDVKTPRIEWLDAAKGISILLVVFGHVFLPPVGSAVQLFRMPFFFCLSGFIFKPGPVIDIFWKRGNSLLVPYAAYIVAITAIYIAVKLALGHGAGLLDVQADLLALKNGLRGGNKLTHWYTPLWFLPVLFFALMAYNLAIKWFGTATSPVLGAIVLASVGISYALEGYQTYLALGVVPVAVLFLWLGTLYRRFTPPDWTLIPAALLAAYALVYVEPVNMKAGTMGVPVLSLVAAAAACLVIVRLCRLLARYRWFVAIFSPLGRYSIVILCMHQGINYVLRDFNVPHIVIYPLAVGIPFLASFVLRRGNWQIRWLFMGEPPLMPDGVRRLWDVRPWRKRALG